jgi:4-hydroxy-2-oxoglutarate aldolase
VNDRPGGLLVPLTTPFDPDTGDVAPIHLRDNARALLASGVDGLVACGSTGEASLLDDDEYRCVVEWLRDVVPPDRWLIAGAGRESTRATVAPVLTAGSLSRHFRRVADESPIPVFLYNMPKYTHVSLTDTLLASLADHPNIWGIKDSSGDLKNFAAYRDAVPEWTLLVGSGALFYAALELGAAGAIAAAGCFAAGLTTGIGVAFAAGDRGRAGAAQEKLAPLHREIVGGYQSGR